MTFQTSKCLVSDTPKTSDLLRPPEALRKKSLPWSGKPDEAIGWRQKSRDVCEARTREDILGVSLLCGSFLKMRNESLEYNHEIILALIGKEDWGKHHSLNKSSFGRRRNQVLHPVFPLCPVILSSGETHLTTSTLSASIGILSPFHTAISGEIWSQV